MSEMSFSFIVTPAVPTKDWTIGSSENVASAGASSVFVQTISRSDMLAPLRVGLAWPTWKSTLIQRVVASEGAQGKRGPGFARFAEVEGWSLPGISRSYARSPRLMSALAGTLGMKRGGRSLPRDPPPRHSDHQGLS